MAEKDKAKSTADRFDEIDPNKRKALELALEKIEKDFGKGSVMALGDRQVSDVPSISTGVLQLDYALGTGGYPRGRVIEIYGPESSGKTTLAIHAMAQTQKLNGIAAIIDAEHAFDATYAEQLGVNIDQLLVSQPDNGEEALEIAERLIRSGAVDLVVVDSVAALTPKAEIEGEMGDAKVGLQARLMSQALRKLTGTISKTSTVCIFINQLRDKIGGMAFMGPTETTTGGNALKFYSSVRLDIRRIGALKDSGDSHYGNRVRIRVVKNKLAAPFRKVEADMIFGEGISKSAEVLDLAVALNVIDKSGAWFSYGDTKLGQGKENTRKMLVDNPELLGEIESKVRATIDADPTKLKF